MIVCETDFERPDSKDPNYSQAEVDYYGHIPSDSGFSQHRLSLRKNLKTGNFEVYRAYAKSYLTSRKSLTIIGSKETGRTEVVFSGSLQGAIDFATKESNRFWAELHDHEREIDTVCDHTTNIASFCRIAKEAYEKKLNERRRQ